MKSKLLLTIFGILFCSAVISAETKPITVEQKFSYGVGFQIAEDLKQKGVKVDTDVLVQAIRDVMTDAPLKVSVDEMKAAFDSYREQQIAERQVLAEKNQKASAEFLAKNKKEKGVTETPSGLQYKVVKPGEGKKPAPTDTVVVNYRGTLIDGSEFDSSYKRGVPATFPVNGVIKGWQEVLPLMKEGAKWQVFVPPSLGYGPNGAGTNIGPNATLVFDIELVSIKPPAPATTTN
jgi:FKBP-type peptidyl-prolyl cis-trans isomerase FklB